MKLWSDYYPWVKPIVASCPDPIVDRALCDAAIEFCEMTQAFVENQTFKTKPGVSEYDTYTDSGLPAMVTAVTMANNRPLHPIYIDALTNAYGNSWQTVTGQPWYFLGFNEDSLVLYPTPIEVESGVMTLSSRPKRSATGWDPRLFERYGEIIAHGALGRLLNQTGTPWENRDAGAQRVVAFKQGINKVRAKTQAAYTTATVYPGNNTFW